MTAVARFYLQSCVSALDYAGELKYGDWCVPGNVGR